MNSSSITAIQQFYFSIAGAFTRSLCRSIEALGKDGGRFSLLSGHCIVHRIPRTSDDRSSSSTKHSPNMLIREHSFHRSWCPINLLFSKMYLQDFNQAQNTDPGQE